MQLNFITVDTNKLSALASQRLTTTAVQFAADAKKYDAVQVDPVVRELAITRTGILCEAPYEVVAHKRIGKQVGVTDEQNAALEDWKSATCFDDLQRAALAFTDEIVKLHRPTDATFKTIAAKLTPAALVELQLSVGFYIMTSKFLETFSIDMQSMTEGA